LPPCTPHISPNSFHVDSFNSWLFAHPITYLVSPKVSTTLDKLRFTTWIC
jgi:hypothetical protein